MPDPSRPVLALRVGITGHRWRRESDAPGTRLDPSREHEVRVTLRDILARIARASSAVCGEHASRYIDGLPWLSLVTALAEGADTIAAEVAAEPEIGFVLEVVAPYDLATHAARCAPGTTARQLWDAAAARLVLDGPPLADEPLSDGGPARHEASLVETNRRLVWNCDLIVAVWDGERARGEAGTAQVVMRARDEGLPVVHIPSNNPSAWTMLDAAGGVAAGLDAPTALDIVVRRLLLPPEASTSGTLTTLERSLDDYDAETPPSWPVRVVVARLYKAVVFLLTGFGADARPSGLADGPSDLAVPWSPIAGLEGAEARRSSILDDAFRRADYYANAFAARHRATFTTILSLAPLAVVCAWCGSVAPDEVKSSWALAELALLLVLVIVFVRSRRLRFHEKWLDYRLLAERLRHHGFLWMLGRTSPVIRVPTTAAFSDPRPAWVNWQYRTVTRPLGVTPITFTPAVVRALAADIRIGLLEAQQQYNRVTHHLAHHADHRLHALPWIPLVAAMVAAAAHVITHALHVHLPAGLEAAVTPGGIVGPAAAAALHGFASQAGFGEIGLRADASAQQLDRFLARLDALDPEHVLASRALGDLVLEAVDTMGADLSGWRVDYLARPLAPPG